MKGPATATKCGPPETAEFRYEARVCTTEDHLDGHGWVLDATEIYRYFTDVLARSEFVSCELLVLQAVRGLLALTPGCTRVEVRLWNGTTNVRFESHWTPPVAAPRLHLFDPDTEAVA